MLESMKRTGMLMMNILISVNRSYFEQAKTMLHSLRRHNQEDITVYLLNRSLDPIAVNKFESYLRKHLRIHLEIIDISATAFEQLPLVDARFSIEIYYRLLAQFLLPHSLDRILWLDADIVIRGSISEFYYQDFSESLLAACPDAASEGDEILRIKNNLGLAKEHVYFNSGVLLLNLAALREKTTLDAITQAAQSMAEHLVYPDQDLLNYLYTGQIKYCEPERFNCQAKIFKKLTKEQAQHIAILHYAGCEKPWFFYSLHKLSKSAIPYLREIALQGKWLSILRITILYALWLVYDKTGICHIVRKAQRKAK